MPSLGSTCNPSDESVGRQDLRSDSGQLARATTGASVHRSIWLAARVQRILKLRSKRSEIFSENLFADPAWDILLELYLARLSRRTEAVSSICLASGVPSTTAIRWIKLLEQQGWICRTSDPADASRCFLSLTPKAEVAMERFFDLTQFAEGI